MIIVTLLAAMRMYGAVIDDVLTKQPLFLLEWLLERNVRQYYIKHGQNKYLH